VLLHSIIGQAFADQVATADLSVVDLAANQNDLAEKLRKMVVERVDDEYGLDVPALFIVNASVPEEAEKALDARSSICVIDDLAAYQQYPTGGIAAGGIGVGMGLAMAGRMAAAPQTPAVPQAPPPPAWHVVPGGQATGPFTLDDLSRAAAVGTLRVYMPMCNSGMASWSSAVQVPQLGGFFRSGTPR
jgi:hypothetical protein